MEGVWCEAKSVRERGGEREEEHRAAAAGGAGGGEDEWCRVGLLYTIDLSASLLPSSSTSPGSPTSPSPTTAFLHGPIKAKRSVPLITLWTPCFQCYGESERHPFSIPSHMCTPSPQNSHSSDATVPGPPDTDRQTDGAGPRRLIHAKCQCSVRC